jgi:lysophospholipase L1-like esterase
MKNVFKFVALLLAFCFVNFSAQQKPDFYDDVQNFKKLNAESTLPKDAILFLGSSSFTMWKDVNNYFPDKTIINRAFGGSRLADLNYYTEELLTPYQAKQVVIYCGENDVVYKDKPSAKEVFNRFKQFYTSVRKHFPNANIAYVSMKYSPSREQFWPTMKKVNKKIKSFLNKQQNANYIDVTQAMNDENGNVRKDLFLDDMLHMKPEGYKIWTKVMYPYLK